MNTQFNKIGVVAFGSFGVSVTISIIIITLSIPLGLADQTMGLFFGNWSFFVQLTIAALAFPVLWLFIRVSDQ